MAALGLRDCICCRWNKNFIYELRQRAAMMVGHMTMLFPSTVPLKLKASVKFLDITHYLDLAHTLTYLQLVGLRNLSLSIVNLNGCHGPPRADQGPGRVKL